MLCGIDACLKCPAGNILWTVNTWLGIDMSMSVGVMLYIVVGLSYWSPECLSQSS